jgi:acetyl-CoA carboxylase carboxyltransferase component
VVDAIVPFETLRQELITRFDRLDAKREKKDRKKHLVPPV